MLDKARTKPGRYCNRRYRLCILYIIPRSDRASTRREGTAMNTVHRPTILVAGADRRQLYAAQRLAEHARVFVYGTEGEPADNITKLSSLDMLTGSADLLVLPIMGAGRLAVQCAEGQTDAKRFTECLAPRALAAGGMLGNELIELYNSLGFDTADYFRREELLIKNAVPTAEGTLSVMLSQTDETIAGMTVLICGWGRVAKACARLLEAAGAKVTIAARAPAQLAEAQTMGFETVHIGTLAAHADRCRVLINTVPSLVVTAEVICRTMRNCLIIDLASKPGGTDFAACEHCGRRSIHALSLPGKYAPITAGEIIADTVWNIYCERSGSNVT